MAITTRSARALGSALIAAVLLPGAVLAAPPSHYPSPNDPLVFDAGTVCEDAVLFENTTLRAKNTDFAPGSDGAQRLLTRGSGVSRVTNLDSGATYTFQGGVRVQITIGADGSLRFDGTGKLYIAWYYPGDASVVGPGLFQMSGRLTEWYAPDGTYIGNAFSGRTVDLCAAVGAGVATGA